MSQDWYRQWSLQLVTMEALIQTCALHIVLTGSIHCTALAQLEEELLNLSNKVKIVYHHATHCALETSALCTLLHAFPKIFTDLEEPTAAQHAQHIPGHLLRCPTDSATKGAGDTWPSSPNKDSFITTLSPKAEALRQKRIAVVQAAIDQLALLGKLKATIILDDETGQNTTIIHLVEQTSGVPTANKEDISNK